MNQNWATEHESFSPQDLLAGRNAAIWRMLVAERAVEYLRIVLELCRFRDAHELEPLHEDVAAACCVTDMAAFSQDIRQLLDWEIITQRIEKERLRGYRDTRRRKFRYRVCDDAVSLVEWLRMRMESDSSGTDADTRDQLLDMVSCLRETSRIINSFVGEKANYENARSAFHRLSVMSRITDEIARSLGDLNIRLLAFASGVYDIGIARRLVTELENFTDRFIGRVHLLGKEIYPEIDNLLALRLEKRWQACRAFMEEEAKQTGLIMRTTLFDPHKRLMSLLDFYSTNGNLQSVAARIRESARMVWRKLNAHLRELERRSHRLEDIRAREEELATMPADCVPHEWLRTLVGSAAMIGDMHEWTETMKATPPEPMWEKHRVRGPMELWLKPRPPGTGKPVQSMDEARLEALHDWMAEHGVLPNGDDAVKLSEGAFATIGDFQRIIDIARSGILGSGRRLAKIGLSATVEGPRVAVDAADSKIEFDELSIKSKEGR